MQTPEYRSLSPDEVVENDWHLKPDGPLNDFPVAPAVWCVNFTAHGRAVAHGIPRAASV